MFHKISEKKNQCIKNNTEQQKCLSSNRLLFRAKSECLQQTNHRKENNYLDLISIDIT